MSGSVLSATTRDLRLDFFRGLALIFIFIDHIPGNILGNFTLQGFQFCDAAEVFIFISGFTAALVYGRVLAEQGSAYAAAMILRRAWQLYVAHIFLFVIFMAEVSYTVTTFNNPMYSEELGVASFLQEPYIAIVQAMLLQFQPALLDILPLYIVLLLAFPPILMGLRRAPISTLVASFLLYLTVQIFDISIPRYPPGQTWFFNPLAWQFLFISGAALGYHGVPMTWRRPAARLLLPIAALIVAATFVIRVSWALHWQVWSEIPALLAKTIGPMDKHNLSPIRLVTFFALVVVIAILVAPQAGFLRRALARPAVLCGRQSLQVFCLSILLSALAHFILSEYRAVFAAYRATIAVQLVVNAIGILVMYLTARTIDWYRTAGRSSRGVSVRPTKTDG